jgi:periplasmic protein TonB
MENTPLLENKPPLAEADDHLSHLLAPELETPWFKSLIQNVRDVIQPVQLPPLEVTSKPVAVKEIWGLYGRNKRSGAYSLVIHCAVVVLLFTVLSSKAVQNVAKQITTALIEPDIAPYTPKATP